MECRWNGPQYCTKTSDDFGNKECTGCWTHHKWWERTNNNWCVCAMNAAGTFQPPMLIYPRKRIMDSLLIGAPPGTVGACTDSECFLRWLKHLVSVVKPSKQEKHIIILDGQHSHKTYEAVMFAREHGIELIILPPHCIHKMQPLDIPFFWSLKAAYNAAAENWMLSNKGRRVTMFEIVTIFGTAYLKCASMNKAVTKFKRTGCHLSRWWFRCC